MLGSPKGPGPGISLWVPTRLGSLTLQAIAYGTLRLQPRCNPCSRHCGRFSPGPEEDSPNPASSFLLPLSRIQTPWQLPGSRTENGMLPPVPIDPSFFPEGPGVRSKFAAAGGRPRAPSEEGGGEGEGAGAGVGDSEGEEQERAASVLPFCKQRCHTRRAPRFLGLRRESRARGRAAIGGPHSPQAPPPPRCTPSLFTARPPREY